MDLEKLRRLAKQATPGPWKYPVGGAVIQEPNGPSIVFGEMATEDGAYIAAANPQTILALLDERDEFEGELATVAHALGTAERRAAALEEAGKALLAHQDDSGDPSQVCPVCLVLLDSRDHEDGTCVVRALLDPAAPRTDKPEDWMGGMKDMEIVGRLPEAEVSEASDDA